MELNAWGIPSKYQSGNYMDAIKRARLRFENLNKEQNEKSNQS